MTQTKQPCPMLSVLSDGRGAAGLSDTCRPAAYAFKLLKYLGNIGASFNRTARPCPMLSGLSDGSDNAALSDAVRSVRLGGKRLKSLVNKSDRALSCSVRSRMQGVMWTGQGGGMGKPPTGVPHPTPRTRPVFGLSDLAMNGGQA
jgi:hypothetical protein